MSYGFFSKVIEDQQYIIFVGSFLDYGTVSRFQYANVRRANILKVILYKRKVTGLKFALPLLSDNRCLTLKLLRKLKLLMRLKLFKTVILRLNLATRQ